MADSYQSKYGFVRRGMSLILAVLVIGAILFGGYQWKVYHRNLQVSDGSLPSLPALTRKDRVLILSPHPDDETLGAGGLMAKAADMGIPVRVVFMTNGDGSLATRLVQDAHFVEQLAKGNDPKRPKNIYRQIAPMRQKEALAALKKLNVPRDKVTFLGYPDGGTKNMWETNWTAKNPYFSSYTKTNHSPYANSPTPKAPYCGEGVLRDVEHILIKFKPTIVITTNPYDTHPDHWAAYAYLSAAVAQLQLQQKYFSWASKIKRYTFIVHHGLWPAPHGYHPDAELSPPAALMNVGASWMQLQLDKKDETAKTAALQQYKSQLATTPQFLRGFVRRNELFAQNKAIQQDAASWQYVIKDPRNDLLLPQLISAADITAVSLKNSEGKVLLARIHLDGKPWKDVQYQIMLHVITAHDVMLRKIIITNKKQHWRATLNSHSLKIDINDTQITISIPVHLLRQQSHSESVTLISAYSILHGRILDQTPTQVVSN